MIMNPLCEGTKAFGHSGPSLHWWLSLTAADQGAWIAGLGAFVAALVAVAISIAQFRRDAAREQSIAAAIAPALIGDLNVAAHVFQELKDNAFKVKQSRIAHHEEIERALRSVIRIRLSAFDRFNEMLPLLGKKSAPIVIECYATILRTVTLIREELETKAATQELKEALIMMAANAAQMSKKVEDAQELLRKCAH